MPDFDRLCRPDHYPRATLHRGAHQAWLVSRGAAIGIGLALLFSSGCGSAGVVPVPVTSVTVGVLVGGAESPAGAAAVNGTELAAELVNQAHPEIPLPLANDAGLAGLGGAELRVSIADSEATAGTADEAMRELVGMGVAGVVAADRASAVELAGAYADRREVLLIDGATTAGYLLDIGLEWYFRTGPTDRALTEAMFTALTADLEPGATVRTITPERGRGADVAALVEEQATAFGYPMAGEPLPVTDLDLSPAAGRLDLVVAVAPAPVDGATMRAGLHAALANAETGAVPPDLGQAAPEPLLASIGQGFATEQTGQLPSGTLQVASWSSDLTARTPVAHTVATLYEERFGEPLTEAAAQAFTATLTLAMAVDEAGNTDPRAIRSALRQLHLPATQTIMPWNGIQFDEAGQNTLAAAVVEQAASGGPRLVYPPELALAGTDG